jgi:hypothetical protein
MTPAFTTRDAASTTPPISTDRWNILSSSDR